MTLLLICISEHFKNIFQIIKIQYKIQNKWDLFKFIFILFYDKNF